jgi:hypothetical protein
MPDSSTRLNNELEALFKDWYSKVSKANGLDPNPDDPRHQYDWRGYFKNEVLRFPTDPDVVFGKAQADHAGQRRFPDTYKTGGYDQESHDKPEEIEKFKKKVAAGEIKESVK